ncbi:T9SS type A sorting domain-containing protein [Flavobacterium sp. DG1-102-2]|uniref:T9SS type A sorting domain-containing protein n=1 Tax=Flavobacterium sp. DG1-102-2 TaxID=3081663 RepID=UPI00294A2311|nr:T9SS type A sorting domain-containing protein [Flavobacterium sp. DG1-102-2]MDV6170067.1 T9SS type A sorting domain-containing protein [Flavobacterium sp. DG1-102-2]
MSKQVYISILFFLVTGYVHSQVKGCTDPLSKNYNPMATVNDGSCEYKSASVSAVSSVNLPEKVLETSGLIMWNDALYTQNDNTDNSLYALNPSTGSITGTFSLTGTTNQDWEEIAQDNDYLYIGDFGNNVTGNRNNLTILKVNKSSLTAGTPLIETIAFNYSNQTDFSALGNNETNFDCEAMVVSQDSIYLFTKQWSAKKTSLYKLPKTAGSHIAQLKATLDVSGLITGAAYLEDKRLIVLSGYNGLVQPFVYLLYDFNGHNFFSGNKRKITLSGMSFHQVEGIATLNGLDYYVSNELFSQQPFVSVGQKLSRLNLTEFLGDYLENLSLGKMQNSLRSTLRIYPNPSRDVVFIENNIALNGYHYVLIDANGREVLRGTLQGTISRVDVHKLSAGLYTIRINEYPEYSYRLIKQ